MPINKSAPSLYLCKSATYVRQSRNTSWTRTLPPKGYVLVRVFGDTTRPSGAARVNYITQKRSRRVSFQVERGRLFLVKQSVTCPRIWNAVFEMQLVFSISDKCFLSSSSAREEQDRFHSTHSRNSRNDPCFSSFFFMKETSLIEFFSALGCCDFSFFPYWKYGRLQSILYYIAITCNGIRADPILR